MNIQQFQYVLAVAEHKRFELAAEHCCVTQSTLSTMISKLEEELGIRIFDRKTKPVQVTNEGAVILAQLKNISHEIDQLKELAREVKGETTGQITLSAIPTVAPYLLPLFLQDFAAQFPGLHIRVREETTGEIVRKLKSRELDIGILSTPIGDKELAELKLYDEPFVFFDASGEAPAKISVKKIKRKNLCLMEEGHCMRTQVMNLCELSPKKADTRLNFEYKAGSIDSLLRFARANEATTLLPLLSVSDFTEREKRHLSFFSAPVPYRSIGLLVHRHFVKKKLLRLLQQAIVNRVLPVLKKTELKGEMLPPV